MLFLILQSAAKSGNALEFLERILVALGVAVGAGIGAYAAVQQWSKKIRENLQSIRNASQQLSESKEEIVNASQKNFREIKNNTEITENLNEKVTAYVETVQRHILSRVQEELGGVNEQLISISRRLDEINPDDKQNNN
jgi:gas vesicle protein